jgi:hypothetical protein
MVITEAEREEQIRRVTAPDHFYNHGDNPAFRRLL